MNDWADAKIWCCIVQSPPRAKIKPRLNQAGRIGATEGSGRIGGLSTAADERASAGRSEVYARRVEKKKKGKTES